MAREDIRVRFGRRLRQLRTENGFTQQALATKAGISLPYVQMLEAKQTKKRKNVTIVTMEKLANAFGLSLADLLRFTEKD